eukprot:TRINITY_DN6098_c0_g1_i1.p1 TRINITY_DN6098_c0_g1~~TRINITY_DN6098_c0_g1_i1.p1  ORF type:complete len:344 (-),score=-35.26 TRINITY_DN6098_c0_g1_i1:575-1606(-)
MPKTILKSISLDSSETINLYKNSISSINDNNPYYCYELLNNHLDNQELFFFRYTVENEVTIIMPYILRKIIINDVDTGYFDVTSSWGYNGPLFEKNLSQELLQDFWYLVDTWYKENKVVSEFLRFNFDQNYNLYTGTTVHTLRNVKGKISDWDYFWSNLKSNTRNQFRKAKKEGLKFELHFGQIDLEKVKAFYDVYIGTMNRRDAKDSFYHPLEYFTEFCSNNEKKCAIGLVYEGDLPISCELFLISDDTMYSFLGGTSSNHFKLRPNEYLKINAIDWARLLGLEYYMIGGGLSNSETDNLYLYKKKYFPFDDDIHFYTGRKIIDMDLYVNLIQQNCKLIIQQ